MNNYRVIGAVESRRTTIMSVSKIVSIIPKGVPSSFKTLCTIKMQQPVHSTMYMYVGDQLSAQRSSWK